MTLDPTRVTRNVIANKNFPVVRGGIFCCGDGVQLREPIKLFDGVALQKRKSTIIIDKSTDTKIDIIPNTEENL